MRVRKDKILSFKSIKGFFNRFLQVIAFLSFPHQITNLLHKLRGVHVGKKAHIARFVYIDDRNPEAVFIGDGVAVCAGARILAHQRNLSKHKKGMGGMEHPLVVMPVIINNGAAYWSRSDHIARSDNRGGSNCSSWSGRNKRCPFLCFGGRGPGKNYKSI